MRQKDESASVTSSNLASAGPGGGAADGWGGGNYECPGDYHGKSGKTKGGKTKGGKTKGGGGYPGDYYYGSHGKSGKSGGSKGGKSGSKGGKSGSYGSHGPYFDLVGSGTCHGGDSPAGWGSSDPAPPLPYNFLGFTSFDR